MQVKVKAIDRDLYLDRARDDEVSVMAKCVICGLELDSENTQLGSAEIDDACVLVDNGVDLDMLIRAIRRRQDRAKKIGRSI